LVLLLLITGDNYLIVAAFLVATSTECY